MSTIDRTRCSDSPLPLTYGYNPDLVAPADVPRSALDFLRPAFKGKAVTCYPHDDPRGQLVRVALLERLDDRAPVRLQRGGELAPRRARRTASFATRSCFCARTARDDRGASGDVRRRAVSGPVRVRARTLKVSHEKKGYITP